MSSARGGCSRPCGFWDPNDPAPVPTTTITSRLPHLGSPATYLATFGQFSLSPAYAPSATYTRPGSTDSTLSHMAPSSSPCRPEDIHRQRSAMASGHSSTGHLRISHLIIVEWRRSSGAVSSSIGACFRASRPDETGTSNASKTLSRTRPALLSPGQPHRWGGSDSFPA